MKPRSISNYFIFNALFMTVVLSLFSAVHAAPGDVDAGFNPHITLEGLPYPYLYAIKQQSDGKILIGGQFDAYNGTVRNHVARANADGSLDGSFVSPFEFMFNNNTGLVNDIAVQPDGKILVAGDALNVGGQSKVLVRLNSNGTLDNTFNANISAGNIYRIVLQPDGKIIIGSNNLNTVDGTPVNYLARLNSNGSLDTPLGTVGSLPSSVFSIALQPDGKIVVGGSYYLVRLNANGTNDSGFTGTFGDFIDYLPVFYAVALQPDGKILVGGYNNVSNQNYGILIRLNADGSRDMTFNVTLSVVIWTILVQADGKILIGGGFNQINGTNRRKITRLNPDGSLDAFYPNPSGANNNIYGIAIQADGKILVVGDFAWIGETTTARTGFARLFDATQPPTPSAPGKIAFVSDRDGNAEIYTMNADGTNQTRLTNNSANDKTPSFSSDGGRIVFVSNRDGNPEIYLMNSDGTNQIRLTTNAVIDSDPAFSSDGNKIVFASDREIYTMNSDGSNQLRLTVNPGDDLYPAFSPDGSKIVFGSVRGVDSFEIYVMNAADGSNLTRLTNDPDWDDIDPAFSSDGSKIVFSSVRDENYEIYAMNADGTNQTRLTFFATQLNTFAREPSFSPDNSSIAFTFFQNGHYEIYSMNASGANQTRLTNTAASNYSPSWGRPAATQTSQTKLKIAGGNILVGSPGKGIILKAQGGAICKLLSIDNAGAMVLSDVICP